MCNLRTGGTRTGYRTRKRSWLNMEKDGSVSGLISWLHLSLQLGESTFFDGRMSFLMVRIPVHRQGGSSVFQVSWPVTPAGLSLS